MSIETDPDLRRLSKRARSISESTTLAIAAETKRMQTEGIHVVSFATGEPDFPTPDLIRQAGIRAIEQNFTRYTQSEGIPELRAAIARKFERDNGIHVEPTQTLVSVGGKHSIYNALSAILDEGDEVIIPAPYWTSYPEMVRLVGGVPVIVETGSETRYKITPEMLRAHITPQSRAVILNSPSNPTGVMYSESELRELGHVIADAGLYVISDELYEKIVYDGNIHFSIGSMPELRDLAITVNGVSKAFSMTGWRIGYMCGPHDVMGAAARIQSQTTSNPTSISQKAALEALTGADDVVVWMSSKFRERRDLIGGLLREIEGVDFPYPDGAFYIFLKVDSLYGPEVPDSTTLASRLLKEHRVATVPGIAFGDDSTIRLSYACSEEDIVEGMSRLRHGLEALRGR